jgi:acetyltransferase-like isoleucine patch superfamily enzyme
MAAAVEPMARGQRTLQSSAYYLGAIFGQVHLKLRLANLVCGLLPDFGSGVIRARLYRRIGLDIGPSAFIMGNVELTGGTDGFYDKLHVGAGASIATHVTINVDADVYLGNSVSLGPYVKIYSGTHPIGPGSNRRMPEVPAKPVTIEDGCWIGLGAVILPGVTIGRGSIVAAGSVVDEDVPANSHVVGNPAQVVRQLPWGDR